MQCRSFFCKILIVPGYKSNPGCKSTPTLSPSIFSRKRSTYNRENTVIKTSGYGGSTYNRGRLITGKIRYIILISVSQCTHLCYSSTIHMPGVLSQTCQVSCMHHAHLYFLHWCVDLPCLVHHAMRTFTYTSTVQRGRGWVVVGCVERVVALSELFWMWMRPWQGKVVTMVEWWPYPSGRHYRFYCLVNRVFVIVFMLDL